MNLGNFKQLATELVGFIATTAGIEPYPKNRLFFHINFTDYFEVYSLVYSR